MTNEKMIWATPELEAIAMFDTAVKLAENNESCQGIAGPAKGGGASDNCS